MIHPENKSAITPELEAEFQTAVRQAMSSKRDPEAMRRAAERMDRMREETYHQQGELDIGVPAIRNRAYAPDFSGFSASTVDFSGIWASTSKR